MAEMTAEQKRQKTIEAVQGMVDEKIEALGLAKTPETLEALKKNQEETNLKLDAWQKSVVRSLNEEDYPNR